MTRILTLFTLTTAAVALVGCDGSQVNADVSEIEAALNQEFGGLTADDEQPMYGEAATFEELGEANEDPADDTAAGDPNEPDVAVAVDEALDASIDPTARPVVYAIAITWGRRVFDSTAEDWTVWNPTISSDCGVIGMARRIALEPGEGVVRPRESAQSITFVSATKPHFDGALLALAIPAGSEECTADGVLRFSSDALDEDLTVPLDPGMADLVLRYDLGDGNQVVAIGHKIEPVQDGCVHGFAVGRWMNAIDETGHPEGHRGTFYGRVMGPFGGLRGHIRGVYGVPTEGPHAGKQVMFGKYINTEGAFRGILAGRYGNGRLGGGWHLRPLNDPSSLKGLFDGQYASTPELVPDGGLFRLRYASLECLNRPAEQPLD